MRVIVIGAGVVGLACAHELAARGADVVVLDRGAPGHGTSLGNTGWVCPSFSYPLPGPGVVAAGLKAMVRGEGPLVIRPTLDPTFARWLWRFWRSSSAQTWRAGVRALLALNERTVELFDAYLTGGVRFELHASGLVLVARDAHHLDDYRRLFRELGELGFAGRLSELTASEARALEPSLAGEGITGGIHAEIDRHVRPETLTAGLAASLRERGVEIREGVEVRGVERAPDRLRVALGAGSEEADRVVVAAGPSSPALVSRLGVRLPLVGARGYSVTFTADGFQPSHALYLGDAKVGVSAYRDGVRIAGVFELGRRDATPERKRVEAMLASCDPYFASWRPTSAPRASEWAGLRPMTADGLPLIGRAPRLDGVFVATGHGMLGVTLAPATAALLAPFVLDGVEAPELVPFRPGR